MFATSPQSEIEVATASRLLEALPIGATLTYADIKASVGRDVHKESGYILIRAVKRAETATGGRYATVRGIGIRRLPTEEIPGIGAVTRRRIRRAAGKAFDRLSNVKANDLTQATQARIDVERSLLGAVSVVVSDTALAKVSKGERTGPHTLPQVLEALR